MKPQFKIHCSAIGGIMASVKSFTEADIMALKIATDEAAQSLALKPNKTNEKKASKADADYQNALDSLQQIQIPLGAQTAVKNWYVGQIYGKNPLHAQSKYTEKGIKLEWQAVGELGKIDADFYEKNTKVFENDFCIGTPDIIADTKIIDIKCSWDCFSFPYFETELNKDYWWQVQGYMELTGLRSAEVVYMLLDAPHPIVVSESYKHAKSLGVEMSNEIEDEIRERLTYSHLPIEMRVKRFVVEYDGDAVEAVRSRVKNCRAYLEQILEGKTL